MSKLIKVSDAQICCRGNTAQLLKDARANFQGIALEFLDVATRPNQAGVTPAGSAAIVQFIVKSLAPVILSAERAAQFEAAIGIAGASALQGLEWTPPELQLKSDEANLLGAVTLEQADALYNQAAQQALAKHGQRVRDCLTERALSQDKKANYHTGSFRSRRNLGGLTSRAFSRIKSLARRLGFG